MKEIWQAFLPIFRLPSRNHMSCFFSIFRHGELKSIMDSADEKHQERLENWQKWAAEEKAFVPAMKMTIEKIGALQDQLLEKDFICRDVVDLMRTIVVKTLHYDFMEAAVKYAQASEKESVRGEFEYCLAQLEVYIILRNHHNTHCKSRKRPHRLQNPVQKIHVPVNGIKNVVMS